MDDVLYRAEKRQVTAQKILTELQLMEKWSAFGRPVLVGSVAHGLVVKPDLDLEIYCVLPKISDGFSILSSCAEHPRVTKARFANDLDGPDQGLYWQLRYREDDGQVWKIDMWALIENHPGPCAADLIDPMAICLTHETRKAILEIKEALVRTEQSYPGIFIYRAVLDDGVRTMEEFLQWVKCNPHRGLTDWVPRIDDDRTK